jgi:hypothetical protein
MRKGKDGGSSVDPFAEATYEQLDRVVKVIDKYKPVELPGTHIPAIGFLERWVDDKPTQDDIDAGPRSTEQTIWMWEHAALREE